MKKLLNWLKQWPAVMTVFMVVMTITIFFVEPKAGVVMSGFTMGYIVVLLLMYFHNKTLVISNPKGIAEQYGFLQNTLLKEIAFPHAVMMDDGKVVWANERFEEIFGFDSVVNKYLSNYIHDLNRSVFPKGEENVVLEVQFGNKDYRAILEKIPVDS